MRILPIMKQLLIIFLILLAMVGQVSAHTSIDSDKVLNISGDRTFMVGMWQTCDFFMNATNGTCAQAIAATPNYTVSFWDSPSSPTTEPNFWKYRDTVALAAGHLYTGRAESTGIVSGGWNNNASFFGYDFYANEPAINGWGTQVSRYNTLKSDDSNHIVTLSDFAYAEDVFNASDVGWDVGFSYKQNCGKTNEVWAKTTIDCDTWVYHSDDFIFASERDLYRSWIHGDAVNVNGLSKPTWMLIEGYGEQWTEGDLNWFVLPQNKLRAKTFWAITTDIKGIGYWGYKMYNGEPVHSHGLVKNSTVTSYYDTLAGEIKSLEAILLLPTLNNSWWQGSYRGDKVLFSSNPNHTVYTDINMPAMNYIIKQNSTTGTYYLIVVNKANTSNNNLQINVTYLNSNASLNVTMLGYETTGSPSEHKVTPITMTNGVFNDTFDGYAVHIYQIGGNASEDPEEPTYTKYNSTYSSCVDMGSGTVRANCILAHDFETSNWTGSTFSNFTGTPTWTQNNGVLNMSGDGTNGRLSWELPYEIQDYQVNISGRVYVNHSWAYWDIVDLYANSTRGSRNFTQVSFDAGTNRTHLYASINDSSWTTINNTKTYSPIATERVFLTAKVFNPTGGLAYYELYYSNISYNDAMTQGLRVSGTDNTYLSATDFQLGGYIAGTGTIFSWNEFVVSPLNSDGSAIAAPAVPINSYSICFSGCNATWSQFSMGD